LWSHAEKVGSKVHGNSRIQTIDWLVLNGKGMGTGIIQGVKGIAFMDVRHRIHW
jgi:hypothetical protein